ncbi:MAG: hypothetical protein GXO86_10390 [Chlorobi bacterium]|nr:hypothetical protein [Chlorobiota bacterium]
MDFREAREMARDPNNIPGIFNYCDAWCDRCLFTSRCLSFKMHPRRFEKETDEEEREKKNEEFWEQVEEAVEDVKDLLEEDDDDSVDELPDFDFDPEDEEEVAEMMDEHEKHRQKANEQPIAKAAKRYMDWVYDWYQIQKKKGTVVFPESRDELITFNVDGISDPVILRRLGLAMEVAFYYHLQIWVKVIRALTSSYEDFEDDPEFADFPKDSDGSAKVALLGIDQSIAAWTTIWKYADSMKPELGEKIRLLRQLRSAIERVFPKARAFKRPGFDD